LADNEGSQLDRRRSDRWTRPIEKETLRLEKAAARQGQREKVHQEKVFLCEGKQGVMYLTRIFTVTARQPWGWGEDERTVEPSGT